jgi:hypothetical protein
MSGHEARAIFSLSHDARGRPFKVGALRTAPALELASAPVTGRVLLESDSTQARSLEGRPLSMYASLRLPDRSRLRLSNPPQRSAPHPANRSDPLSAPLSSLAQEKEGRMRPIATELERWKNERL